jgi:hypothetical protein
VRQSVKLLVRLVVRDLQSVEQIMKSVAPRSLRPTMLMEMESSLRKNVRQLKLTTKLSEKRDAKHLSYSSI